ncbi:MAG: alanine racemase [Desulfobulbaceae bacterium]|nr:alanine racemase [Desulfobulbaceae bacterium]
MESLNRVEISRTALRHNFLLLRKQAADATVMVMVKADGYGHGMIECAKVFSELGACAFGVAEAVEGVRLRQAGFTEPVFVLAGILPEIVPALFKYNLTPVVVDDWVLPELSRQAQEHNREIGLHLKTDAGMGRQGCLFEQVSAIVQQINRLPGLRLEGIMAHFPMADDRESQNTSRILSRFHRIIATAREYIPEDCRLHIANSGGLLYGIDTNLDMVRPGISLYGCYPNGEQGGRDAKGDKLQSVMRFVTRVIQLRRVPAGTGLGYGHIFTTSRPTTLVVLPAGYEDGYLRCLSGKSSVLVKGQRAPVVGRISMNLTLVDVTDLDGVQPGDEVVLLGRQGEEGITADEIAGWMGTINYEVLCLFGNLNNRVFVD